MVTYQGKNSVQDGPYKSLSTGKGYFHFQLFMRRFLGFLHEFDIRIIHCNMRPLENSSLLQNSPNISKGRRDISIVKAVTYSKPRWLYMIKYKSWIYLFPKWWAPASYFCPFLELLSVTSSYVIKLIHTFIGSVHPWMIDEWWIPTVLRVVASVKEWLKEYKLKLGSIINRFISGHRDEIYLKIWQNSFLVH